MLTPLTINSPGHKARMRRRVMIRADSGGGMHEFLDWLTRTGRRLRYSAGFTTMTAENIALGYKQLLEVERGWRDMKSVLDLRPVYHRLEERIRAHVISWLALLLIRVAETTCYTTWPRLRRELQRIALGTFTGPAGIFRQRAELAKTQRDILAQLKIDPPPRIFQLTTETP